MFDIKIFKVFPEGDEAVYGTIHKAEKKLTGCFPFSWNFRKVSFIILFTEIMKLITVASIVYSHFTHASYVFAFEYRHGDLDQKYTLWQTKYLA